MKDKITNFVYKNTLGAGAVVSILMLMLPVPAHLLEILIGVELAFAIGILVYSFTKKKKVLPQLILYFCLFVLAMNISLTRRALIGFENGEQVPLIQKMADLLGMCNPVAGFVIAMIVLSSGVFICSKGSSRVAEIAAKYVLDSMNQELFDIDDKLNSKEISKQETSSLKDKLRQECDFYSNLVDSAHFLKGSTKVAVLITVVNFIGGFLIKLFICKADFKSAFSTVFPIGSANVFAFTAPLVITSFAIDISERKILKKRTEERKPGLTPEEIKESLKNEFTFELGMGLIDLVDKDAGAPLITAVMNLRKERPEIPKIRIVDNMQLGQKEYFVHWKDTKRKETFTEDDDAEKMAEEIIQVLMEVYGEVVEG